MQKQIFILIISLVFGQMTYAQYFKLKNNSVQFVGAAGIGVGQENLVSMPKLSGLMSIKLGSKSNSKFGNFQKNAFYVGAEGSILIFFTGAWSISGTSGIKINRFTTDCSLTRLWLANPNGSIVSRQTTLNPKFGIMFGPVWLKGGPSFLLTNENIFRDSFGNFMHIGKVPFNLELNYNLTW